MSIHELLQEDHSRDRVVMIAEHIGDNQALFDELMVCILNGEERVTYRGAWIMSHCVDKHPQLAAKHIVSIIEKMQEKGASDAMKRSGTKVLIVVPLPDEDEETIGLVAELAFDFLGDMEQAVAIRANAMTVAYRIVCLVPELKNELKLMIEVQMPTGSAAITSRGRKILKKLR